MMIMKIKMPLVMSMLLPKPYQSVSNTNQIILSDQSEITLTK